MRVRLPPDQHLDFGKMKHSTARNIQTGQSVAVQPRDAAVALNDPDVDRVADFLSDLLVELDSGLEPSTPNPHLRMILHLMRSHSEGRIVSPSSLVASAGVPYATATRKLAEVEAAGLIDRRARTRTGKSHSLHPSANLLEGFSQLADRIDRLARQSFGLAGPAPETTDYYFGGSYQPGRAAIAPPRALPEPLKLSGGLRILVHGDPTFMVMEGLKRQF